jgi:hypothetical protein
MRDRLHWARLLAYVTGLVNQELLLKNEYLVAESRILRAHLPGTAVGVAKKVMTPKPPPMHRLLPPYTQ